jgi:uncharacterized protein DUF5681
MSSDEGNVGYKRPPVATRFRAGVSGNPSGRPKRCASFRETLLARLAEPASGGSGSGDTNLHALVTTLVKAAVSGDARAQALVLGALNRFAESGEQEAAPLTSDDQQILDAHAAPEESATINNTRSASDSDGNEKK